MKINPGVDFVYQLLGNVTPDELPLEIVLPIFRSQVDKYAQYYEISIGNYFADAVTIPVTANEMPLQIPNLREVLQVQILRGFDWIPLNIVSLEALDYEQRQGRYACAIFGMGVDTRIRFSTDFEPVLPALIRVWYEPYVTPEEFIEKVPAHLVNLIAYETAVKCVPHLIPRKNEAEVQALSLMAQNYIKEIDDLKRIFDVQVNWTNEHKAHRVRPFHRRNLFRV